MKPQTKSIELSSKIPLPVINGYLFIYNATQTIGWTILLLRLLNYILFDTGNASLYQTVKYPLIIFQMAAVLEILHAATKIVQSNTKVTSIQVFFRILVVCGIITPSISAQNSIGFPIALLAWSVTEVIRYAYYALNCFKAVSYYLVWLRYTTFIVLYPLGGIGEFLCLYAAQKEIGETGLQLVKIPDFFNFAMRGIIFFLMLLFAPAFAQLYTHMFAQRKKVLGRKSSSVASKKN